MRDYGRFVGVGGPNHIIELMPIDQAHEQAYNG